MQSVVLCFLLLAIISKVTDAATSGGRNNVLELDRSLSTCASVSSQGCTACLSTTGCHWCPDGKCHAYLSPYGCVAGPSCHEENNCVRPPGMPDKSRTTSSPSAKMVGGFLFLSLLALTCAGACSCMISAFAGRFIEEREEGDRRYTELTRLEDQDGLLAEGEGVTEEGRAFIPRVKVVTKTPAHKYLSGCASACCCACRPRLSWRGHVLLPGGAFLQRVHDDV